MSIVNAKRMIKRLEQDCDLLSAKYQHNKLAVEELNKLRREVRTFEHYLNNIDSLKPDYNTNEIEKYMQGMQLHIDILKECLQKNDFAKLQHHTKVLRTVLKFHPTKYSTLAFIFAWLYEWLYFI